ncbi:citrate/2-methylcitrate synthase [Gemmatimonas sp.]|uniref:citrate/2-methylcitrate synthase n=1 Tax=Gemmatimonas sp. TaxID=1962908 RepID=UPI003DA6ABC9
MRAIGSSGVDPFSAVAGGIAALFGPLHGGANEAVLRMISDIGDKKNIPAFIEAVKSGKGEQRLMGFGHRVYKSYDPRARIVKKLADEVFAQVGMDKDLEIALELERIALSDDYFIARKLYPNVDFYTGLIYRIHGVPHGLLHGALCRGPCVRLDGAVGRDDSGQGAEDRASASDLRGRRRASSTPIRSLTSSRGRARIASASDPGMAMISGTSVRPEGYGRAVPVFTVDVEDWFQVSAFDGHVSRDQWEALPSRVERNTDRLLQVCADTGTRGTFFTLGWVAERFPSLVQRIVGQGH